MKFYQRISERGTIGAAGFALGFFLATIDTPYWLIAILAFAFGVLIDMTKKQLSKDAARR